MLQTKLGDQHRSSASCTSYISTRCTSERSPTIDVFLQVSTARAAVVVIKQVSERILDSYERGFEHDKNASPQVDNKYRKDIIFHNYYPTEIIITVGDFIKNHQNLSWSDSHILCLTRISGEIIVSKAIQTLGTFANLSWLPPAQSGRMLWSLEEVSASRCKSPLPCTQGRKEDGCKPSWARS